MLIINNRDHCYLTSLCFWYIYRIPAEVVFRFPVFSFACIKQPCLHYRPCVPIINHQTILAVWIVVSCMYFGALQNAARSTLIDIKKNLRPKSGMLLSYIEWVGSGKGFTFIFVRNGFRPDSMEGIPYHSKMPYRADGWYTYLFVLSDSCVVALGTSYHCIIMYRSLVINLII